MFVNLGDIVLTDNVLHTLLMSGGIKRSTVERERDLGMALYIDLLDGMCVVTYWSYQYIDTLLYFSGLLYTWHYKKIPWCKFSSFNIFKEHHYYLVSMFVP